MQNPTLFESCYTETSVVGPKSSEILSGTIFEHNVPQAISQESKLPNTGFVILRRAVLQAPIPSSLSKLKSLGSPNRLSQNSVNS